MEPGFYWAKLKHPKDIWQVIERDRHGYWWFCSNEQDFTEGFILYNYEIGPKIEPPKEGEK